MNSRRYLPDPKVEQMLDDEYKREVLEHLFGAPYLIRYVRKRPGGRPATATTPSKTSWTDGAVHYFGSLRIVVDRSADPTPSAAATRPTHKLDRRSGPLLWIAPPSFWTGGAIQRVSPGEMQADNFGDSPELHIDRSSARNPASKLIQKDSGPPMKAAEVSTDWDSPLSNGV